MNLRSFRFRFSPGFFSARGLRLGVVLLATNTALLAADAASWAGSIRCEIEIEGPGYSDQQTHTWTLTGGTPANQGAIALHPATWSVTGQGWFERVQGAQTSSGRWTTNVPAMPNAPISVFIRASDSRLIIKAGHAQLRASGKVTGTQQTVAAGKVVSSGALAFDAYEFAIPVIEDTATATQISGSNSSEVSGSLGPMQPGGSRVKVTCVWELGKGSAKPLPPPTMTPRPPPSGGQPSPSTPSNPSTPTSTPSTPSTSNPPSSPSTPSTSSPPSHPSSPSSPSNPSTPPGQTPVTPGTPGNSSSPNPGAAKILSVTPNTFEQGAIGSVVTITGQGTHWTSTSSVSLEPGIGAPRIPVHVDSPTSLMAQLDIQYSAAPGPHALTVTTGTEVATLPNAITLTARDRPELISLFPNQGVQGQQRVAIKFTGKATRWAQGKTTVSFSKPVDASATTTTPPPTPPRLTVESLTVESPTSMTAFVTIDPGIATGAYWVSVWDTASSDWLKLTEGFTVTAAPTSSTPPGPGSTSTPTSDPARIVSLSPAAMNQGSSGDTILITGHATNWQRGVSTVSFGPGISLSVPMYVVDAEKATAIPLVDADAAPGPRTVTITTGSNVVTLPAGFTVQEVPGSKPGSSPETAVLYQRKFANTSDSSPSRIIFHPAPTGAGTSQWWKIGADDKPSATTPLLQFVATVSGGPADCTYQVDLVEETAAGRVTRSISANGHEPVSSVRWSNVSGTDDSKTFYVVVRHVSGQPSTDKYQLKLEWGGPPPPPASPFETATVVTLIPPLTTAAATSAPGATNPGGAASNQPTATTTPTRPVTTTTAADHPAPPEIVEITPAFGHRNQRWVAITLTAKNTHFVQTASLGRKPTKLDFGPGITVTSLTVTSPTTLKAVLDIGPVSSGARNVTVTTGDDSVQLQAPGAGNVAVNRTATAGSGALEVVRLVEGFVVEEWQRDGYGRSLATATDLGLFGGQYTYPLDWTAQGQLTWERDEVWFAVHLRENTSIRIYIHAAYYQFSGTRTDFDLFAYRKDQHPLAVASSTEHGYAKTDSIFIHADQLPANDRTVYLCVRSSDWRVEDGNYAISLSAR
ncbi:MAG TPA: hypothetical protein VHO24_06435 [Opitutaceae bacterium]|nr:hypothetical protein [Opitutaceae bacterium]